MTSQAPTADVVRCSTCGHPLDKPPPPRCPLCEASLLDNDENGADVTPYARGFARDEPSRGHMNQWVWFAGWQRLTHLALMRSSAASRAFARANMFLMAGCLAAFAFTNVGWRIEPTTTVSSSGDHIDRHAGWLRLVEGGAKDGTATATDRASSLWWCPIQSGFGAVHGFILGLVACAFAMWLVRAGAVASGGLSNPDPNRMTAALHYATAWIVPLIPATVVVSLRPLAYIGEVGRWSWHPSVHGLELAAAVVGAFAFVMWWFWLFRVGATAAARIRRRVVLYFAVGPPTIVVLTGFAWYIAVNAVNQVMFRFMRITF